MAFPTIDVDGEEDPIAEINMVPLIDVMLVLLIIFMVTAPLLTHAVKLDLPRASSAPSQVTADPMRLDIDAGGQVYWNGDAVDADALAARLSLAAQRTPRAELLIRADRRTSYEALARVMSQAARQGVERIGFLTDPHDPDVP